jgi:hypothetical protein
MQENSPRSLRPPSLSSDGGITGRSQTTGRLFAGVGVVQAALAGVGYHWSSAAASAGPSEAVRKLRMRVLLGALALTSLGALAWAVRVVLQLRTPLAWVHLVLALLSLGAVAALAVSELVAAQPDGVVSRTAFGTIVGLGVVHAFGGARTLLRLRPRAPLLLDRWPLDPLVTPPSFSSFRTWCDDKPGNAHCDRMDDLIYAVEQLRNSASSPYRNVAFADLRDVSPAAPSDASPADPAMHWLLHTPFRPHSIDGLVRRLPLRYPPRKDGKVRRLREGVEDEGFRTMAGVYSSVLPKEMLFSVSNGRAGAQVGTIGLVQRVFPVSMHVDDRERLVAGTLHNGRPFSMQPPFAVEVLAGAIVTHLVQRQLSPFFPVTLGVSQTGRQVVQISEYRGTALEPLFETLRADEIDSVVVQAMLAIGAMNHAGIVHNDLHPNNVLVQDNAVQSHLQFHDAARGVFYRLPLHGLQLSIIDFGGSSISTPEGTAVSHQESNLALPLPPEAFADTSADVLRFVMTAAASVSVRSPKLEALLETRLALNTMLGGFAPAVFGTMTMRQFGNKGLRAMSRELADLATAVGVRPRLLRCAVPELDFADILRGLLEEHRVEQAALDVAQPVFPLLYSQHRNLAVGEGSLADRTARHRIEPPVIGVRDDRLRRQLAGAKVAAWDGEEARVTFAPLEAAAPGPALPPHPLFDGYTPPFAELMTAV